MFFCQTGKNLIGGQEIVLVRFLESVFLLRQTQESQTSGG